MRPWWSRFGGGLLLAAAWSMSAAQACEHPPQPKLRTTTLAIQGGDGRAHRFTVEMALTGEQQSCGLMLRQRMGQDEGMIFVNDPPRPVAFWMKNTVLPLDMVFIGADGRIAQIAENTVPFSTDTVESRHMIAVVLEVLAGTARRLGLRPGDRVTIDQPPG